MFHRCPLSSWRSFLLSLVCWVFVFNHGRVLEFVKCFCCISSGDTMFFPLYLINMIYYIEWLLIAKPSLHFWDKTHVVTVSLPLILCYIQFAGILLRIICISASVFVRDTSLWCLFLWYQGGTGLIKWLESIPSSTIVERIYEGWCWFFCLVELTGDTIWYQSFSFLEVFRLLNQSNLL